MTDYLLATASVHVTAAAADYLGDRLDPTDELVVVGVREPTAKARDVDDAANVARSRLAATAPTVELRDGDPTEEILTAIDEHDPDVLVIGAHEGIERSAGLGSTATTVLESADVPVVVVPLATLD